MIQLRGEVLEVTGNSAIDFSRARISPCKCNKIGHLLKNPIGLWEVAACWFLLGLGATRGSENHVPNVVQVSRIQAYLCWVIKFNSYAVGLLPSKRRRPSQGYSNQGIPLNTSMQNFGLVDVSPFQLMIELGLPNRSSLLHLSPMLRGNIQRFSY